MFPPVDPDQMLEEHRRRTAIDTCLGVLRAGTTSGKSLAQRIKAVFKRPSSS